MPLRADHPRAPPAPAARTIPTLCFLEGLKSGRRLPPVHGGACRHGSPVSRLHHAGAGRDVGGHQLAAAVTLSPHDRRTAAGGTQSRLRGLRGQRSLRTAGHGVRHGHHQRALRLQLPPPARGPSHPALRARPQPLHSVHALCAHLRRNRRRARVGGGRRAASRADRLRTQPANGATLAPAPTAASVSQACPTGALAEKGKAVRGDDALQRHHYRAGPARGVAV